MSTNAIVGNRLNTDERTAQVMPVKSAGVSTVPLTGYPTKANTVNKTNQVRAFKSFPMYGGFVSLTEVIENPDKLKGNMESQLRTMTTLKQSFDHYNELAARLREQGINATVMPVMNPKKGEPLHQIVAYAPDGKSITEEVNQAIDRALAQQN